MKTAYQMLIGSMLVLTNVIGVGYLIYVAIHGLNPP